MAEDVRDIYIALLKQGMNPKEAAKKIQNETGFSAVTGKPIKQKKVSFSKKGYKYGRHPVI